MRTKSIHKIRQRKTLSMLASVLAFVLIAIFSSIVFSNAQIRNVYAKKAIVTKQLDEVASLLESIKNINDIVNDISTKKTSIDNELSTCRTHYSNFKIEKNRAKSNSNAVLNSGLFMGMTCTPEGWIVVDKPTCKSRCNTNVTTKAYNVDPKNQGEYTIKNISVSNMRNGIDAEYYTFTFGTTRCKWGENEHGNFKISFICKDGKVSILNEEVYRGRPKDFRRECCKSVIWCANWMCYGNINFSSSEIINAGREATGNWKQYDLSCNSAPVESVLFMLGNNDVSSVHFNSSGSKSFTFGPANSTFSYSVDGHGY